MNNQFSLQVKAPCTENFNNFSSTQKGGYCGSCKKEVIDFSTMNSQEIIDYFEINKNQNTCGRFKSEQLKMYNPTIQKRKKISFISGLGFAFIALFSFSKVHAQNIQSQTNGSDETPLKFQEVVNEKNISVKGVVTENGTPLPGVTIVLEGTTVGVSTDFDGYFKFPSVLKKGDVLVFSYVGFNSKKVVIQDENSVSDITLSVNLKMDSCVLMGKVAVNKVYTSKKD